MTNKFSQLSEQDQYNLTLAFSALRTVAPDGSKLEERISDVLGTEILQDLVVGTLTRAMLKGAYTEEEILKFFTNFVKDIYSKE